MGSTFLSLTNKVLKRLNEVELTSSNFASARNVGAAAKDSVVAAIAEINTREWQWPWNKQDGRGRVSNGIQELQFGTVEPVGMDPEPVNIPVEADCVPDWYSFKLIGTLSEDPPGTWNIVSPPSEPLVYVPREQWYAWGREDDGNSVATGGRGVPRFVFPYAGGGYGVTPMPNGDYILGYEMYITPAELVAYGDTCSIPTVWDYVIVNMALRFFYMFKDNQEGAAYWGDQADKTFARMRYAVINRPDSVYSYMNNFGTGQYLANWYGYVNDAR